MTAGRRQTLNLYIQAKGEVRLSELEELLPDVSSMTLRRDLEQLERDGEIVRTRGGAKSIAHLSMIREAAYTQRVGENLDAKMGIAAKAVQFVTPGRSLYLDAGTTAMCLAQQIPDESLFILTSAPNIALELAKNRNVRVALTGGQLNRETLSLSGGEALAYMEGLNIDVAFLTASAFSLESGFTVGDRSEADLKRLIVRKARTRVLLVDGSKLDRGMPYTFARLPDAEILITDGPLPPSYLKAAKQAKTTVVQANAADEAKGKEGTA
jgi:DeoR family transcriptional regulator, fructose operon transcriptional repressor